MLTNEQKISLLNRAVEVQERVEWTTGEWVEFIESQRVYNPAYDELFFQESCGVKQVLKGFVKECKPASMVEAVKSTCLEGAVLVAAYEQGICEHDFYDFMYELGDIAGLPDAPNGWNDNVKGAGSKENVVLFLKHARDYFDGKSNEALLALLALTQPYRTRYYGLGVAALD